MQPETDVGSELPLTSFDFTYPGLAVQTTDFRPQCQRDKH